MESGEQVDVGRVNQRQWNTKWSLGRLVRKLQPDGILPLTLLTRGGLFLGRHRRSLSLTAPTTRGRPGV